MFTKKASTGLGFDGIMFSCAMKSDFDRNLEI